MPDFCRTNRGNLLREIVDLKRMHKEPLSFESKNSAKVSIFEPASSSEDDNAMQSMVGLMGKERRL